jgi:hypothetical protein
MAAPRLWWTFSPRTSSSGPPTSGSRSSMTDSPLTLRRRPQLNPRRPSSRVAYEFDHAVQRSVLGDIPTNPTASAAGRCSCIAPICQVAGGPFSRVVGLGVRDAGFCISMGDVGTPRANPRADRLRGRTADLPARPPEDKPTGRRSELCSVRLAGGVQPPTCRVLDRSCSPHRRSSSSSRSHDRRKHRDDHHAGSDNDRPWIRPRSHSGRIGWMGHQPHWICLHHSSHGATTAGRQRR